MATAGRVARERARAKIASSGAAAPRGPKAPAAAPPRRPTFWQRAHYRFDATMSNGPIALVAWPAALTVVLILAGVALVLLLGLVPRDGRHSFIGQMFSTLMHALDPGTVAGDGGAPAI